MVSFVTADFLKKRIMNDQKICWEQPQNDPRKLIGTCGTILEFCRTSIKKSVGNKAKAYSCLCHSNENLAMWSIHFYQWTSPRLFRSSTTS